MTIQEIQRLFEQKNAKVEEARALVRQLEVEIYQLQGRYAEAQEREKEHAEILRAGSSDKPRIEGETPGTDVSGQAEGIDTSVVGEETGLARTD